MIHDTNPFGIFVKALASRRVGLSSLLSSRLLSLVGLYVGGWLLGACCVLGCRVLLLVAYYFKIFKILFFFVLVS